MDKIQYLKRFALLLPTFGNMIAQVRAHYAVADTLPSPPQVAEAFHELLGNILLLLKIQHGTMTVKIFAAFVRTFLRSLCGWRSCVVSVASVLS